jgi:hypothetical protein
LWPDQVRARDAGLLSAAEHQVWAEEIRAFAHDLVREDG